MLRMLGISVQGTSHRTIGSPCQDNYAIADVVRQGDRAFAVAVADGAGSASHADVGARVATQAFVEIAAQWLRSGSQVNSIRPHLLEAWIRQAADAVASCARAHSLEARDMACTLLGVTSDADGSAYVQVGDGAIVVGPAYVPVFWPDSGEYLNTTSFITSESGLAAAQVAVGRPSLRDLAVFTDGLQMLALNYARQTAHQSFFARLFASVEETRHEDLAISTNHLARLLDSDLVNSRTDDDKTLVLIRRLALLQLPEHATSQSTIY